MRSTVRPPVRAGFRQQKNSRSTRTVWRVYELLFANLLKACARDSKGYRRGYPLAGDRAYGHELKLKWGSAPQAIIEQSATDIFHNDTGTCAAPNPAFKMLIGLCPVKQLSSFLFCRIPAKGFSAKPFGNPAQTFHKSLTKLRLEQLPTFSF